THHRRRSAERAATHRKYVFVPDHGRASRIFQSESSTSNSVLGEPIVAPLPSVTMHVKQSIVVRLLHSDRRCSLVRVVEKPGVFRHELDAQPIVAAGLAVGSTGILPLRLRWQPIPGTLQIVNRRFHSLSVLALIVRFIAPLLLGNALVLTKPIAV